MLTTVAFLLAAGGDTPPKPARSTFPALVHPSLVRADTTSRGTRLQQEADRLRMDGKFNEARHHYLLAVAVDDSASTFPGDALWALANMEYGRDRELRAAEILDQLAEAASRYGRPEWQATALLEAGIIYQNHGRTDLSVARVRTLKPLLSSPAIPASVRAQLASRIAMK